MMYLHICRERLNPSKRTPVPEPPEDIANLDLTK